MSKFLPDYTSPYFSFKDFFSSILSRQLEQSKCPFLVQNDLVDLSISFLQIRHLNMGVIEINSYVFKSFI